MWINAGLVQIDVVKGNKNANMQRIRALISSVFNRQIILLPELWNTGYDLARKHELAEDLSGDSVAFMIDIAREKSAFVGGSILRRSESQVLNTFVLVNARGIVATYDKVHLFKRMEEDLYLAPGQRFTTVDLGFAKAGLAVCYDLRFPEMFREYIDRDVNMILLVAQWPTARYEHWCTLTRARAIENQCFLLACNRVGGETHLEFNGGSMAIDPWGVILAEGSREEGVVTAEMNLNHINVARTRFPVLPDRRKDLY
ncbi:MAG: carbon-nitrogen family hydrolase [Selenomonadales bacterium]|nr:carbon-nitrogen family hydrolase [Selenomonadales bacterium]